MDPLRELAGAILEAERGAAMHPRSMRVHSLIEMALSREPDRLRRWRSGLEAERRSELIKVLYAHPPVAARAAETLNVYPRFIESVADEISRAAQAGGPQWDALHGLGIPPPPPPEKLPRGARIEKHSHYLRCLKRRLLLEPVLLVHVAELLHSAVPFSLVLSKELDEIEKARSYKLGVGSTATATPDPDPLRRGEDLRLLGLALSGGGIRSATFNLGVLQALADFRLLRRVDLLSTVSGGGYIGAWLAAWIKRHERGVSGVEGCLSPTRTPTPGHDENWPISFLRQYSNYLTPKWGVFSADTWTLVTTWVRNTLLNQLVLMVFLASSLLFAHLVVGMQARAPVWPSLWLFLLAMLILSLQAGKELGSYDRTRSRGASGAWSDQSQLQGGVVIPSLIAAVLASSLLSALLYGSGRDIATVKQVVFWGAWLIFSLSLLIIQIRGRFNRCFPKPLARRFGLVRAGGIWVLVYLIPIVAGFVGACIMVVDVDLMTTPSFIRHTGGNWGILVIGPPLLMQGFALAVTLQQGFLGREFPDERREWWSRLGAWVLIYSLGWLAFVGVAILIPFYVMAYIPNLTLTPLVKKALGFLWAAVTAGGVFAAQSTKTGSGTGSDGVRLGNWRQWLAVLAPYVFITGLAVLLSTAVFLLLTWWYYPGLFAPGTDLLAAVRGHYWCLLEAAGRCGTLDRNTIPLSRPVLAGIGLLAGSAAALLLAWRVDVNEFSMHHFYKNRLVRCYLGASRGRRGRSANRFTGFDPDDDVPLARLHIDASSAPSGEPPEHRYDGPYPVINTALNLVTGENLAWQERKAASFVFTPHYSGYELDLERTATGASDLLSDGYRPTAHYAYPEIKQPGYPLIGGPHLGTTVAISGAAANPNMGYHSSAATSLLMTLFNVRLGWWMGNPRHQRTWRFSSPRFVGLLYLLHELTGNSDDRSGYVDLSDGGHFDNLGLYELVRRRCRFMIVSDAEEDQGLTFGGLGNTIRKCRADFGVEITLRPARIRHLDGVSKRWVHCAVGEVTYPDTGTTGTILYLKASLTGDESADVLEYAARQPRFPHQSTGDQWFDESQFESYRALGHHIATKVMSLAANAPAGADLTPLFRDLQSLWSPPGAEVEENFTQHSKTDDDPAAVDG
jgi:hypothetical protein